MSDYYTESQVNRIEEDAYNGAIFEAGKEWERQRDEFNSREHELQSRIAELEGIIKSDDERLAEAGLKVNLYFGCDTAEIMAEEILSSRARIAELEAEIERLTVHSDIERQDDKWIPVSERLPEGGHREFYEVACIYQDFGELALFSKGRWVIYEGENVYNVTKRVKFWRKRQYLPDEVIAVLSKGEMNPEVQE